MTALLKNTILTYLLLGFAICAAYFQIQFLWIPFFALALILGLAQKQIQPIGIVSIVVYILSAIYLQRSWNDLTFNPLPPMIFFVISTKFYFHKIPGITAFGYDPHFKRDEKSSEFELLFWFDKPLIGLLFFAFIETTAAIDLPLSEQIKSFLIAYIAVLAVLLPIGLLIKYISFNPKWEKKFSIWAVRNLLFTCVSEEILFRAFFIGVLLKIVPIGEYQVVAICLTSALFFALTHFKGGISYIALSFLAGIGY